MARRFTKGIDMYQAQLQELERLAGSAREAFETTVRASMQDAYELTSGPIKQTTLDALGNPFGRGRTPGYYRVDPRARMRGASLLARRKAGIKGAVPLLPINVQSGRLRRSFSLKQTKSGRRFKVLTSFELYNAAPYAQYILSPSGTRKMIGRGFTKELERRWRARRKSFEDYQRLYLGAS